jgi:ATP-dependent Lon protease
MEKLNIPVLPIQNLVFFPKTAVPLNIENPTVIKMIKDCVEFDCPIGLSLMEGFGLFVSDVPRETCGIGMAIILEESPTQLKVIINGTGKVKLGSVVQNFPYPVYEAELIEEAEEDLSMDDSRVEKLRSIFASWLDNSILNESERLQLLNGLTTIDHIVDYISMFIIQDVELRQLILEVNSLSERIQMLNLLINPANPFAEDFMVAQVFKEYETLEKTAEIAQ